MAVLKLRVYWAEDDSVYRDVAIKHTQTFLEFHQSILRSWEFDNKHQATFFRSNDNWQRGREITLAVYDKKYAAPPMLMGEVTMGTEIRSTNQKFVYIYDFLKNWEFNIELIKVDKEINYKGDLPVLVRAEGLGPTQYGVQGLVDKRLNELEEKFGVNLEELGDGYGDEGDDEGTEEGEDEQAMDGGEDEY